MENRKKTLEKARQYGLRLLGYRPRSQIEFQRRLQKQGFCDEVVNSLVEEFKDKGLLDDKKFASLWANRRFLTSLHGISFIKAELSAKGLGPDIIKEAIAEIKAGASEEDIARELLKKRTRLLEKGLSSKKAEIRLYSYFKRHGFSDDIIYKLLDSIKNSV